MVINWRANAQCTDSIQASIQSPICNDDSNGFIHLYLSDTSSVYTYAWSNGDTLDSLTNLFADTYYLTVSDTSGCFYEDSFILNNPDTLSFLATVSSVSCFGDNNGSILLNPNGGSGPVSVLWNNGSDSLFIDSLSSGYHSFTLTDSLGCSFSDSVFVGTEAEILDSAIVTHIDCYGNNNGQVNINPIGGSGQLQFLWSDSSSNDSITLLSEGSYFLTITDSLQCSKTFNYNIIEPPLLQDSIDYEDVHCIGGGNGQIEVIASGGTLPYIFQWSNGASSALNAGLSAGGYTYTLSDSNGCSLIGSINLIEL